MTAFAKVDSAAPDAPPPASGRDMLCFHCGTKCRDHTYRQEEKLFCCQGCLAVFSLLTDNGLGEFYNLSAAAGVRISTPASVDRFKFLDEPLVRERLVDYADARTTRVTFHLPAIHCIACLWLLENLFQLQPGIRESRVNFPRKEVMLTFDNGTTRMSDVVTLLTSLGYEPELKLSSLGAKAGRGNAWKLWIKMGVAGFAFGNIMLFSLAAYFGLDATNGPTFRHLTGWISLILAAPVVIYSAGDYWQSAWNSLRDRQLNIDVPLAAGILAIFLRSAIDVVSGHGNGYFDSLTGLIFFLLCGKWFQQKNYDRLAFDRDYTSFFPLSVTRIRSRNGPPTPATTEEHVSLAQLAVGDRLAIRNGELIPADARLAAGPALIDYSFVTGESAPVEKKPGDHLYAGGRQMGGRIEIETVKAVSQSYLTSLWDRDSFHKDKHWSARTVTDRYARRFTKTVVMIAAGAALFWCWTSPALALKAFTSVLIVACPCAVALAAPFTLGTAQRLLARRGIYLKNPYLLEAVARVDAVVFDKTGTLTAAGAGNVRWQGPPLTPGEEGWIYSMTRHSTHPLAVRIGEAIQRDYYPANVRSFLETTGCGMEGNVEGNEIWAGSAAWLQSRQVEVKPLEIEAGGGSLVHVALNGKYRGCFLLAQALRTGVERSVTTLGKHCSLALLSGDNEKEQHTFRKLLGPDARLEFNQSPLNKLDFIGRLQSQGKTVMMVGDGLNDAGALKQADIGVAVVENAGAFSPASDIIISSRMVPQLGELRTFARRSMRIVRAALVISALYNVVGIGIAASAHLAPVVCAILMPASSISVVSFACLAATWNDRTFRRKP